VNLLNAMRRITAAGTVLEIQTALPADAPAAEALRRYGLVLAHALHPQDHAPDASARQWVVPAAITSADPVLAEPLGRIAQQARQVRQLRDRIEKDPPQ
ncbi:MAG: FUSC family protein, partial [Achromobacter pestifer]